MNKNILLSIVIPTKNRYYFLKLMILGIIKSTSNKFEIIIQDNSDNNEEILDFLKKTNDKRLKYNHVSSWLSVSDNFDCGVNLANGKFVIVLGDDDGILIDDSIAFLEQCNKDVEAIVVEKITYSWPGNTHHFWNSNSGKIDFHNSDFFIKKLDVSKEMKKQLKLGFSLGLGKLPRLYHGFVLNKCLKKLRLMCETCFPGPSPDMANAVALSKFIKNVIYTNKYLVISGHSSKSAGGMGSNKKHVGGIHNHPWLPKDTAMIWSKKIPFFWSGPTIYCESARQALFKTKNSLYNQINFNYLYSVCFVYEDRKNITIQTIKENRYNTIFFTLGRAYIYLLIYFNRINNFLKNLFKNYFEKKYFAKDINEAISVVILNTKNE